MSSVPKNRQSVEKQLLEEALHNQVLLSLSVRFSLSVFLCFVAVLIRCIYTYVLCVFCLLLSFSCLFAYSFFLLVSFFAFSAGFLISSILPQQNWRFFFANEFLSNWRNFSFRSVTLKTWNCLNKFFFFCQIRANVAPSHIQYSIV